MTHPLKFRQHVLAVRKAENLTLEATSKRFKVGRASLTRWIKDIKPKAYPLRMYKIDLEALRQDFIDYPDSYQHERAAKFGVCRKSLWQAMKHLNISRKKNTSSPEGGRAKAYYIQE